MLRTHIRTCDWCGQNLKETLAWELEVIEDGEKYHFNTLKCFDQWFSYVRLVGRGQQKEGARAKRRQM